MRSLFNSLLAILTITLTQATLGAQKADQGLQLMKQYVDAKVSAVNVVIGNINGQINSAVEAAKTVLRGEISAGVQDAKTFASQQVAQEVIDRNAAIAVAKGQGEAFTTSLVANEVSERNAAIAGLASTTQTLIAGVNTDLTGTKARISAIETSDAGSADDFLPFTIVPDTTASVLSILTSAAADLSVTPEGDRTYLILFQGGGGVQKLTFGAVEYDVNAGEKMRVKLGTNGAIQYVIHIADPYAEQLADVSYGVGQINTALTLQNTELVNAVSSLSGTVAGLTAALAAMNSTPSSPNP